MEQFAYVGVGLILGCFISAIILWPEKEKPRKEITLSGLESLRLPPATTLGATLRQTLQQPVSEMRLHELEHRLEEVEETADRADLHASLLLDHFELEHHV